MQEINARDGVAVPGAEMIAVGVGKEKKEKGGPQVLQCKPVRTKLKVGYWWDIECVCIDIGSGQDEKA